MELRFLFLETSFREINICAMYCLNRIFLTLKIRRANYKPCLLLLFGLLLFVKSLNAQENNPYIAYNVPFQNLLKFNRFLINPTFSTVREDKSYLNMFHRNQSAFFEDNLQSYFLSYSGRINDRIGLGVSVYNQQEGVMSNIGVMANYAYGVRLSENSNLTLGVNIPYFRSGFDHGRANIGEDPLINDLKQSSIIMVQPGINISFGKFDFGLFAENLFDMSLATGESLTAFGEKTFSGHIQYTHNFEYFRGVLEDARLMPLIRSRMTGGEDLVYGGGVILDLPNLGWLQGGYDSFYGASAGVGFNLSRRLSLGYSFEKGLTESFSNFGITHEISIALSFAPRLTENRVYLGSKPKIVKNRTRANRTRKITGRDSHMMAEIEKLKRDFADKEEKTKILQTRIDSLEAHRDRERERRMRMILNMVKQETNGTRPDLEERAIQFLLDQEQLEAPKEPTDMEQRSRMVMEMVQRGMKEDKQEEVEATRKYVVNNTPPMFDMPKEEEIQPDEKDTIESSDAVGIVSRGFNNIPGIRTGHYIVANVFGADKNLKSFVEELNRRGLNANHFKNPENGLNYVFLARYDEHSVAVREIRSNLNGKYFQDMWIMSVDNSRLAGMANNKLED